MRRWFSFSIYILVVMALTACGGGGGGGGEGGSGDSGGGTAPSISISSPTANTETTSTINLSGSCDSTISSISISGDISSPSSTTCTSGSFSVTITLSGADGSKSVTVSQTNSSGTGTDSRTFVLNSATDPLYVYAWHLENTGQSNFATNSGTTGIDINVKNVFTAGIKGTGVTVAVSDSGIETGHEDLTDNYSSGISKNFLLSSPYNGDPVYNSANDGHGTAVTGLISAEGWNDLGSRGVAPNSKFGGFNTLATGVTQSIDMILYQMTGSFDVFNYSYGLTPCAYQGMGSNSTERTSIINAFESGISSLRSGKGAVYVKSAGNQFISDPKECLPSLTGWETYYVGNSTWLENNNFPYLVVVGAVNADGEKSSYSNQGPNIWISAPGGEYGSTDPAIMTTDISGCSAGISESTNTTNDFEDGHALNTTCNYTSTMNGTSSAAPIVSGVVALLLEANPNLTWRDVKHILASTATINDSYTGFYTHPFGYDLAGHTYQTRWVQNTAGYYFHNYYGFGLANAEAAVTMAQNYTTDLGTFAQLTDPNTGDWTYDSGTINQSIPNNSSTGTSNSITVNHNFIVEAVQIRLSVTHNYVENLGVELTSPGGTKSIITNINSAVLDINIADKILMTNAFYGEESKGAWTIKVIDGANVNADGTTGSSGTLTNWKLNVFGHKPVNPSDSTAPNAVASVTHSAYKNSTTQTPAISFPASSSGDVLRYEMSIGTTSGGTDVLDWFSIGTSTSHTATGLSLTNGQTYYANVRVIDTSENISAVTSSTGWTVDTVVLDTAISNNNGNLSVDSSNSVFTGTCEANATLTVTPGTGVTVNSSSCNSSGVLSLDLTFTNGRGKYTITISQTDPAGNTSGNETLTVFYFPKGNEFISLGDFHGCLLDKNGAAKCWGKNDDGQLGNGSNTTSSSLVTVSGLSSGVKSVSVGAMHSCAVTTSGGAKCWGDNTYGQLGNNSTTSSNTPVDVNGLTSGVEYIVGGSAHSCALLTTGAVKCWGYNGFGSLGDSSTTDSLIPVNVTGLSSGVTYIFSNRGSHTCALLSTGGVKCWGYNEYGQVGNNSTTNATSPVDVSGLTSGVDYVYMSGYSSCAKLAAGGFKCWGYNLYGQLGDGTTTNQLTPVDLTVETNLKEISLGEWNICGIKDDNTSSCWGYNIYNQLSTTDVLITTPKTYPVSSSVVFRGGMSFMCVLNTSGNLNCRGQRTYGQTGEGTTAYSSSTTNADKYIIKGSTGNAFSISLNQEHGCYTSIDNNTYCFGSNDFGKLGDTRSLEGNNSGLGSPVEVTALNGVSDTVSVGLNHSCVLTTSSGVKCWGRNSDGQLGNSSTTNSLTPVDVTGLTSDVSMIASGRYHTCALITSTGGIKCWGDNNYGQLGNNSTTDSSTPVDVSGLTSGVQKITASGLHTCALLSTGGLKCWGYNANGQLGDNSTTQRNTPVDVTGLTSGMGDISAGRYHTCALTTGGAAKCWGSNFVCALGNNDGTCNSNYLTAQNVYNIGSGADYIFSGDGHSCAYMSNNAIRCWGSNSNGQLGKGTLNTNYYSYWEFTSSDSPYLSPASMAVGGSTSCLINTSDDAYCWGDNTYGQRGDGKSESLTNNTSAINGNIF